MARQMKDSGIEWIGEIPEGWVCCKQKHAIELINGRAYKDDEFLPEAKYRVLRVGNLFTNSKWYYSGMELEADKYCECGDLIYAWSASYGPHIWDGEKVIYHYHIWKTVLSDFLDKKFAYYYLLALSESIAIESHGSAMQHITMERMNNSYIAYPVLSEQHSIAAFLDRKCAEIDAVIERTKATIEEYKKLKQSVITEAVTKGVRGPRPMKDSGFEWIGEIPEGWLVRKGKWILTVLERPVLADDGVITCFRDGEVTLRSKRREDGFTFSLQEVGYQGIEPGDLVVHGMDGFAGAIGISDSRGKSTPVLNVLDSSQNKKYVMYYLRSMAYNGIFIALATGIRVRSCDTNWNKLKELPYLIPSLAEQEEIVNHIDRTLRKYNTLIAKKTALLTELETYKKSLIYEYVTGKKEV